MSHSSSPKKSTPQPASSDEDEESFRHRPRNALEAQAARIERLMTRVDKPIALPERKEKTMKPPPDFVRNVQGSSAGAGSGEFHVYRALRRKEYARQKILDEKAKEEQEQREFHEKLEAIKKLEAEKTAKKREKRQKRKKGQNKTEKQSKKPKTGDEKASVEEGAQNGNGGEESKETTKAGESDSGNTPPHQS
ncbi:uncharacterized protein SPPG_07136 [Spizellomyces punctatus DAOM BR117]|uniref:DUF1168 domain-containing protein n=1 Tax=Spizellomyces punctatus (strain DAOM BR117) TaxID=645134 RepID=A0A0L0H9U6_SPIPD|nr:uncharacterized protein SPPG_07136 [Spizellomyces punctatus DAOM BR117]KNC97669.1 hypothetical protein SPPG_07136 [Spizellomyces punctatus DAOM BR117]|eukprot:XP_016605709.1 hypothetical protein SPPG_07136 [Spizellomyces punctatus DAOM BR117]